MPCAHRVGRARRANGEWCHARALVGVISADSPEVEEVAGLDVDFTADPGEHVEDLGSLVGLVAGRDGGMRREHDPLAHAHQRVVDRLVALPFPARELQSGERGVSLVEVDQGRFDAELAQHARAAHTEQRVLRQTDPVVAVIQAGGDPTTDGRVLRQRGVEQVQGYAADVDPPHVRDDVLVPHGHGHFDRRAVARDEHGGQRLGIDGGPVFVLVAAGIEALVEVAAPVTEADTYAGQVAVGRFLEDVAGEDAEAAGIDRERRMHREFGAEERNGVLCGVGRHVSIERRAERGDVADELWVVRGLLESRARQVAQEADRVVVGRREPALVDSGEDVPSPGRP